MKEEWRPVTGYEGVYEVSNQGNVRKIGEYWNRRIGHTLKPSCDKGGYMRVTLSDHANRAMKSVHRLVAEAFCVRKKGQDQVNHINGNKTDNRSENLEWCTQSENMIHAYKTGLEIHYGKPIMCIETGEKFANGVEAARAYGLKNDDAISRVCRGERKRCKGLRFTYLV